MPLKSYRGFNTGNTIKRSNDEWCTTRGADGLFSVNMNRRKLQVDDHEFERGIHYSLKKKRRWLLREYIRQQLDDAEGPFAGDRVELAEGEDLGCRRVGTHYMLRKSAGENSRIREFYRKRGAINRKAVSWELNDQENEPEDARHVTFDIMQPSPFRSNFVRNPHHKYQYQCRYLQSRQTRVDFSPLEEDKEIVDETHLQFLLDQLEDECDQLTDDQNPPPQHNLVDFVVPKTEKIPRRIRRSRSKSDSSDEGRPSFKDRKVIEEKVEEEPQDTSDSVSADTWMEISTVTVLDLNDSTELIPERLQFHSEQLKRSNLLHKYGERYLEGDSTPRKFAISIGEELGKDITVYLVFEEVNAGQEYSIFDVFVNANVTPCIGSLRLFKENPYGQEAVLDVAEFVADCVDRFRQDLGPHLIKRSLPIVVSYSKRPAPLENEPLDTRRVDVLREPDNPEWSKAVFNRQNSRPAASDDWELVSDIDFELVNPVCGICFESLESMTNFQSIEGASCHLVPSCTLNACGHQFCHACWRKHLIAGIRQGQSELRCPDSGCKDVVDVVTVMRFVSLSVHSQHAALVETTQVERDPATVWCPSPNCGKAVKLEGRSKAVRQLPLNVECACGHSFCFVCREEPHWPTHCRSYQIYKAKLQLLGDLGLTINSNPSVVVKGKTCPVCNLFMEKNGGCNSMICRCKANFCWHCGGLVSEHKSNAPCYFRSGNTNGQDNRKPTKSHEFVGDSLPPNAIRSKHYCNTVKWRAMRLNRNPRGPNYWHLSRGAIRELLFKSKKKQGLLQVNSDFFPALNLETIRVERNYEEILRIIEFSHVAAMSLVKTQLPAVRILRNCAQRLSYLAICIRDCVSGQRNYNGPKEELLHKYFAEARGTVCTIQNLSALRDERFLRKTM